MEIYYDRGNNLPQFTAAEYHTQYLILTTSQLFVMKHFALECQDKAEKIWDITAIYQIHKKTFTEKFKTGKITIPFNL
jgi:hypothetical protein